MDTNMDNYILFFTTRSFYQDNKNKKKENKRKKTQKKIIPCFQVCNFLRLAPKIFTDMDVTSTIGVYNILRRKNRAFKEKKKKKKKKKRTSQKRTKQRHGIENRSNQR